VSIKNYNGKTFKPSSMYFSMGKYRFIKVRCQSCKNEQTIFEGATTKVKCLICDAILAEPKGGKAEIKARVVEVLN
jgi:small subunit ribosomal protein S27e